MRELLLVGAGFGLMAFTTPPETAAPAGPEPVRITRPDWERLPSGEDMARYYPQRATRLDVGGRVTLRCTVDLDGTLKGCAVAEETPPAYGFGDAALRLSKLFRMKPATRDGVPVSGGQVRIPIVFSLPEKKPLSLEDMLAGFAIAGLILAGVGSLAAMVLTFGRWRPRI